MNTSQYKLFDIQMNDLKQENNEFKSILKEDLLLFEIRLKDKLSDQFKWVIGVFLTLALMIIGLYLKK